MPRQARIDAPGALQHSIVGDRGPEDLLGRVLQESGTTCYTWTLLPNHVHWLLQTGNGPVAAVMRRLLTGYAVTCNRRHGPLFQNCCISILCQLAPYLLELTRYIPLNPLRDRRVRTLGELDRSP